MTSPIVAPLLLRLQNPMHGRHSLYDFRRIGRADHLDIFRLFVVSPALLLLSLQPPEATLEQMLSIGRYQENNHDKTRKYRTLPTNFFAKPSGFTIISVC